MEKSGKNIINFTSFNSSLGKNEIFSQDDDISGFKCYISFFKNYKKNNQKCLTGIFILLVANFFDSLQNGGKISLLYDFLNLNIKKNQKKTALSFENSNKINTTSNLWGFLEFCFNFIKSGKIADLIWVNLIFSFFSNFEILLSVNILSPTIFQIVFFMSYISVDYLFDLSLIEHSLTMEKNCLNFFTDFNGLFQNIRNSPGSSNLIIDDISKIYHETVIKLKIKMKLIMEKNFLPLRRFKKLEIRNNRHLIISKIHFDISLKGSKINFFPCTQPNGKIVLNKDYFPKYLTFEKKLFLLENAIDQILTKIKFPVVFSKDFIEMIWYKKFFSIKHEIEHLFISWVFCFVISIHIRPPKIEWIHHFIKLFPIFKDNIMVSCFENLLKNASKKYNMIKSISLFRLFYLYFLLYSNGIRVIIKKNNLKTKNFHRRERLLDRKKGENLLMDFQKIYDCKFKDIISHCFSLKNIKIFSVINTIENSIENSKLIHKIEVELQSLFLKFAGFDEIISILIHCLTIIKKKLLFSLTIEKLRRKTQKFQKMMITKSSRYQLLKIMIKSNSKRMKLGNLAIIENLISLKLININYLPRAMFEIKIFKHFNFKSNFETIGFFFNRMSEWQRTTRFDRRNLQSFLKASYKREQKIAIKTLVKVKKAKKLFANGILNYCLNFIESISFFLSYKLESLTKLGLFKTELSRLKTRLIEIGQLNLFYHLYLKRIWFI